MAVNYNTISEKIFAVLKGSGYNVKMYSAGEGMETPDPQEAKFFYVEQPNLMIHIDDDLGEVNFHKGEESLKEIETVVGNVKKIAQNNLLDFNIKQFGKTIEPKNYVYKLNKHNKADTTMTDIQTESYSPLVGSSKTSEQKLEGAKLIIKHRKAVDDEIPGSRSRSIKSLYIANNDGERFKYPFNHLAGARAMARHVAEGGTPYDDIGASICQLSERIAQLRDVAMVARNSQIAENTKDLMPLVQEKLAEMRMAVQKITTEGGYKEYAKNYKKTEALAELDEESSENLKSLFTVQSYNEKMDKVLPLLNSLVREKEESGREDIDLMNYAKQKIQSGDIDFNQKTTGQEKYDPRKIGKFADPAAELTYRLKDLAANIKDDELSNFIARTAYKLDKYRDGDRDHGLTKPEVDTAKQLVKIGIQKQKDLPIVPDKDDPLDDEAMESISEAFSIDRMLGELAPSRLKMDYVGSKVDQTLSYDNWLKQTKGIERGANGISAGQHIKFAPEYKAYKSGMKKEDSSDEKEQNENTDDMFKKGGKYSQTAQNKPVMFKGKQIDLDSVEYDMQDYSDLIFELEAAKYMDGTDVADEDMADLNELEGLVDWVAQDYMDRMMDRADMMRDSKESELDIMKRNAGIQSEDEAVKEDSPTKTMDVKKPVDLAMDSIWDKEGKNPKTVNVTKITITNPHASGGYMDDEPDEGYRSVNVEHDGPWTIYTDSGFEKAISDMVGFEVSFTEQGMQEDGMASMEGDDPKKTEVKEGGNAFDIAMGDAENIISQASGDKEAMADLQRLHDDEDDSYAKSVIKDYMSQLEKEGLFRMQRDIAMQENKTPGRSHYDKEKAKELAKKDGKNPERLSYGELMDYIKKAQQMDPAHNQESVDPTIARIKDLAGI
jgi:hypothetical protein